MAAAVLAAALSKLRLASTESAAATGGTQETTGALPSFTMLHSKLTSRRCSFDPGPADRAASARADDW
jgi:hypothetical protein